MCFFFLFMASFVLCITALTLLMTTFLKTEQQAQGIALFLTLTLAPLGGAWWPLAIVPEWMRIIGHISPVAWVMDGFHALFYTGAGFEAVIFPVVVLLGMTALFFGFGVRRFKYGLAELTDQVGVVTGLAWTEVGGDLLQIEALKLPGKGRMKTTGKLGDVMKESIDAAASYVRSKAPELGVTPPVFETLDIHVHVPEGATPKDGPSAGVGMVTSIVSVLTGIPVRRDVAMTGEVTLRGNVLPIGGLKEKLLAALRGGITTVMIPEENLKDLREIPDNVKDGLKIIPASNVMDVLKVALTRMPEPVEWDEVAEAARIAAARAAGTNAPAASTH